MKKSILTLLGVGLLLTSCQSDEPFAPTEGGEKQVTFTLNVPGDLGTRSGATGNNSGVGGWTNLKSSTQGNLSYTLVLSAEGHNQTYKKENVEGNTVTFSPTVVLGREYTVTAYAHFSATAQDPLTNIEVEKGINDESKDVYFFTTKENAKPTINFAPDKDGTSHSFNLKRPYAKLRLIAEDYNTTDATKPITNITEVTVSYNNEVYTVFNAVEGYFNTKATKSYTKTWNADYYEQDVTSGDKTIFADYIPVNGTDVAPFTIKVKYSGANNEEYVREFNQDIPVKRNALTTLKGNFFTAGAEIKVEVKDEFETPGIDRDIWDGVTTTTPEFDQTANNGEGAYIIDSAADFAGFAALVNGTLPNQAPMTRAANNYNFVLTSDIDLGGYQWTPIGTSAKPYTGVFDGNGHTISNLVVEGGSNSNIGLFGNTQNGEIKNLIVENAKVSGRLNVGVVAGTPYTSKYTDITVKGHVEVNGMAYVGAVGGKNAYADWTNITVNVDGTSYVNANSVENGTAYRTYVGGVCGFNGEGSHTFKNITSNIDVKGSTCDVGGLFGIAHYGNKFENCVCTGDVEIYAAADADEAQEIGGIAGVWHNQTGYTVEFTNCSFTGTLKTNIEGFDLSGKTLVGAAYSATGTGKLIINGATAVATAKQLAEAVKNGATNLYLLDGEYDVYGCGGKTLTLSGSKNAVLKVMNEGEDGCDSGFDSSTVTFNGLTINTTANNGNYKGYTRLTATYNNCNFVGAYTSHKVQTFNNCTFDFKNGYFWIWGATEVNFNGCTFNGNSKNILAHGWESSTININNCAFAATEKGYTGAGDNTACVEIDPAGSNIYTINFTGNNTKTDSYNGWTRVKDDSTGHTITGLN